MAANVTLYQRKLLFALCNFSIERFGIIIAIIIFINHLGKSTLIFWKHVLCFGHIFKQYLVYSLISYIEPYFIYLEYVVPFYCIYLLAQFFIEFINDLNRYTGRKIIIIWSIFQIRSTEYLKVSIMAGHLSNIWRRVRAVWYNML